MNTTTFSDGSKTYVMFTQQEGETREQLFGRMNRHSFETAAQRGTQVVGVTNEHIRVRRNDPCPCRSGR